MLVKELYTPEEEIHLRATRLIKNVDGLDYLLSDEEEADMRYRQELDAKAAEASEVKIFIARVNTLLQESNGYVLLAYEKGEKVPEEVKQYRQDLRTIIDNGVIVVIPDAPAMGK